MYHQEPKRIYSQTKNTRRGAVAIQVAISMTFLIGFASLAIDVGLLYSAKSEMQRAADSAALAGAANLQDSNRLRGVDYQDLVFYESRQVAVNFAQENPVIGLGAIVDPSLDIDLGFFDSWDDLSIPMTIEETVSTNAVHVTVLRDESHGGSISLLFASIFGVSNKDLSVEATAAFEDCITGFTVTSEFSTAKLLPFALHVDYWNDLISGVILDDNYQYSAGAGVQAGADGIAELNLYPGSGGTQLPPGNFGTVDIGSNNNSTADIARQILYGPNADDFSYLPGSVLELGSDGTVDLNGDTGLSAGVKDELAAIIGEPRIIPIFNQVAGPGNNATYTVIGFAGIRILYVKLTGPMTQKRVIIQPAFAVDPTGIDDGDICAITQYVYRPPILIE